MKKINALLFLLFFVLEVNAQHPWLVKDINQVGRNVLNSPVSSARSMPSIGGITFEIYKINGVAIFNADDGVHGVELWRSDGTESGTYLLKDITPGIGNSLATGAREAGNVLYFTISDNLGRGKMWRTDGTTAGTFQLLSNIKHSIAPIQQYYFNRRSTVLGDYFYFLVTDTLASLPGGYQNIRDRIYKTDGTIAGTYPYFDAGINGAPGNIIGYPAGQAFGYIESFIAFDNKIYINAISNVSGTERANQTAKLALLVGDGMNSPGVVCNPGGANGIKIIESVNVNDNYLLFTGNIGNNNTSGLYRIKPGESCPILLQTNTNSDVSLATSFNNWAQPPIGDRYFFRSISSGNSYPSVTNGEPSGTFSLTGLPISQFTYTGAVNNKITFKASQSSYFWDGTSPTSFSLISDSLINKGVDRILQFDNRLIFINQQSRIAQVSNLDGSDCRQFYLLDFQGGTILGSNYFTFSGDLDGSFDSGFEPQLFSSIFKVFTGNISNDWHTSGNWSPFGIPTETDNVVIPALVVAKSPVVTSEATCHNLTMSNGSIMINSGANLNIHGYVAKYFGVIKGPGSVTMKGSRSTKLYGSQGGYDRSFFDVNTVNINGVDVGFGMQNQTINSVVNFQTDNKLLAPYTTLTFNRKPYLTNYSASRFVVANKPVIFNAAGSPSTADSLFTFPIGTSANDYSPATFIHKKVSANFTVSITDSVNRNGNTGSLMTTKIVNKKWAVSGFTEDIKVNFAWNASSETPGFDRTKSSIMRYVGPSWIGTESQPAVGTSGYYTFSQPFKLFSVGNPEQFMISSERFSISFFSPASGPTGTEVMISGSKFNNVVANNIVFFGAAKATVTSVTSETLKVIVPTGANYQYISVTDLATSKTVYSNKPFGVTFPSTGGPSFVNEGTWNTGVSPAAISIMDIDGDGKSDLVVPNNQNNTVSIFLNTSSSGVISFADKTSFEVGMLPYSIVTADVDGDGRADIVVPNLSGTVSVLRNLSAPGIINFASKLDLPTGSNPRAVIIGDIDGDGKPDLAVTNFSSNTVSVIRNTSTGAGTLSFSARQDFSTGSQPQALMIGDIDGDGKPDLAVTNYGSASISVLRNISAGSIGFAPKVDFPAGAGPFSITLGDIDNDGKPDLAIANQSNHTVSILRNVSANGGVVNFAPKIDIATGNTPKSLRFGDVNGDGKVDLAISNAQSGTVSVLINTTSGPGNISFDPKADFNIGNTPYSVAVGDIDGDGKPDLALPNQGSNTITVLRNNTLSTNPVPIYPYSESFRNTTASNIIYGGSPSAAILTAASAGDANGAGYLRLTNSGANQSGFVRSTKAFPTAQGMSVSFEYYTHGGSGGDGLSFFLYDAAANSAFQIGAAGGSLGYAQTTNSGGLAGVSKGYLGIGLDEFGNFSNPTAGRQGGPGAKASAIALRGDGNGTAAVATNYEYLTGIQTTNATAMTAAGAGSPFAIAGMVNGRTGNITGRPQGGLLPTETGYRKARVELIPNGLSTGFIINVWITEGSAGVTKVHQVVTNYNYIGSTVPEFLSFGFVASTGGSNNFHEVRNLNITLPQGSSQAPFVTDVSKTGSQNTIIPFTALNFTEKYSSPSGIPMQKIKVTSLPAQGTLKLNAAAITLNQEIEAGDIQNMSYMPSENFTGSVSFGWNGTETSLYAVNNALVSMSIAPAGTLSLPYSESFRNSTASNMVYGGTAAAVLTASQGTDAEGAGYLKLTSNAANQSGFVRNTTEFPTDQGLNITFDYYTHTGTGGDGLSFFLYDATANSAFQIGASGGSLGYAQNTTQGGVSKGYLAFGFDTFGNFSAATAGRQGGPGGKPSSLTIRGDGNGLGAGSPAGSNYEFLTNVQTSNATQMTTLNAGPAFPINGNVNGRTAGTEGLTINHAGYRKVQIELKPNGQGTGFIINVWITEGTLAGSIVHHVVTDYNYLGSSLPANLSYGFAGSTGGSNNHHEIRNLDIRVPGAFPIENWMALKDSGFGSSRLKSNPVNTAKIIEEESKVLDATNLITPNGDGKNDVWVIRNINEYPGNSVRIFNNKGIPVYSKSNYSNDWDGTFNGSQLEEDTYYYILDLGRGGKQLKGYISIVR